MLDYPHLLTNGQVDQRKVKRVALRSARHQRDISIIVYARMDGQFVPEPPPYCGLGSIAAWRRVTARKLMIAGARGHNTAELFAAAHADKLEDATFVAARYARLADLDRAEQSEIAAEAAE